MDRLRLTSHPDYFDKTVKGGMTFYKKVWGRRGKQAILITLAIAIERSEDIKGGLTFVLFTSNCLEGKENKPS